MPLRLTVPTGLCTAVLVAAQLLARDARDGAPGAVHDRTAVHVLNRLGYGPSAEAIERVGRIGAAAYIDEQLQPASLADASVAPRIRPLSTLALSPPQLVDAYFRPDMQLRRQQARSREMSDGAAGPTAPARAVGASTVVRRSRIPLSELAQGKVLRSVYSERQLEEVLVDFWFNHFNVFAGKGQVRVYLAAYERDAIRPHAMGRFRDLLGATARSPAMLLYLDNWQSAAEPGMVAPARGARGLARREQARRVSDGPEVPAGAGGTGRRRGPNENYARELMELHTLGVGGGYTQKDVQEAARAFTGWTIDRPAAGGPFIFDPSRHDSGAKTVLGHRIPAGGGRADGERVLDILATHPSTARFIARKLAQRFVSDDPPGPLVDRAAATFRRTAGDIRAVLRDILTSPEFLAPASRETKVKTPLEFVASAIRATGTEVDDAVALVRALRDLGMPMYGAEPPTGHADRAAAWVNTGALLNRMNFAIALTGDGLRGLRYRPPAAAPSDVARRLAAIALSGPLSPATEVAVARASTAGQAAALILGSPEFQKR